MTVDNPIPITLSAQQVAGRERLVHRANRHLSSLSKLSAERESARCSTTEKDSSYGALKTPRVSNCVGVFGRRGSGKTSVLVAALHSLRQERELSHGDKQRWKVVCDPLDLSYAPAEFPLGLTVLHWLHTRLCNDNARARLGPRTPDPNKAFGQASKSYFRGARGFNRLVRDLAITPEHYARSAAKEIRLRNHLYEHVQEWLDAEAKRREVAGFVVAIDDLDLAPANKHHSLVWSLLDELHQDRLFFLLASDLMRLERHVAEEDAHARRSGKVNELDLPTAQDLVYKVVPQVDRCELMPWQEESRRYFPPVPSVPPPPGEKRRSTIDELLGELRIGPVLNAHLDALLPEWARGLENVRRELEQRIADRDRSTVPDEGAARLKALRSADRSLLVFLAESTFQFDLARALRQRPLGEWAGTWRWRAEEGTPADSWNPIRANLPATAGRAGGDDLLSLLPEEATNKLPLNLDRARWAEVLLDVAMAEERLSSAAVAQRVVPFRVRLDTSAQREVSRTWTLLRKGMVDSEACVPAALTWVRFDRTDREHDEAFFQVGLRPILDLALARRRWWSRTVEDGVVRSRSAFLRDLPEALRTPFADGDPGNLGLAFFPARTRPLARFLNRVGDQPWDALSGLNPQVGPVGMARVAAALTYLSLRQGVAPRDGEGGGQAASSWPAAEALEDLRRELASGSAADLNRLTEEGLRERFEAVIALADEDLVRLDEALKTSPARLQPRRELPVHAALDTLLRSPCFRGLDPALEDR